jgi:hypothetical protein
MTFEEFRASGRDVANLDDAPHHLAIEGPGRVYCYDGGPFIQRTPYGWHLHIERDEWDGRLSQLEPILFEWAAAEGFEVKADA